MIRFVTTILTFAIAGGCLVAHGQQSTAVLLSDRDKAGLIESVLDLELQAQASVPDFENIRDVSDYNIEFIDPSWLSNHGLTIIASSKLRESRKDHVVQYLLFRKIYSRDELVVVELSRVIEGSPCFGPPFFTERTYTYAARRTSNGWVAQLIRRPGPMFSFAPKRSATKPLNIMGNPTY